MASVTVKGISAALLAHVGTQAARHRHSLNSEILACLKQTAQSPPEDVAAILARADLLRARWGTRPLLTDRILKKAKAGRRP